ncbi:MAG: GFA family protein [Woeseiaceae bacterium]
MPTEYEGACHCRKVRYSFAAAPEATFFCHCNDCQRTTGSPFSVELMVSSASFEVEGELATYTVVGDSGKHVHRRFCPRCGSGIYLECDADPGYVFLKAGTLNDAGWVKPDMHIFTVATQPWANVADSLPRHERMPPE